MTETNESWRCPIPDCFATPFTHERIKNPLGLCARHLIEQYDHDREYLVAAVAGRNALLVEAKAEIRKLHEECDRLTELVGNGEAAQILGPTELTEPGLYRVHYRDGSWKWVEFSRLGISAILAGEYYLGCQFIGPIAKPEERL